MPHRPATTVPPPQITSIEEHRKMMMKSPIIYSDMQEFIHLLDRLSRCATEMGLGKITLLVKEPADVARVQMAVTWRMKDYMTTGGKPIDEMMEIAGVGISYDTRLGLRGEVAYLRKMIHGLRPDE